MKLSDTNIRNFNNNWFLFDLEVNSKKEVSQIKKTQPYPIKSQKVLRIFVIYVLEVNI